MFFRSCRSPGHHVARQRCAPFAAAMLFALGFSAPAAAPAAAQGITDAFGGFAASPDQPIDIQANRLDIDDRIKRAVFTGKVVAIQDTFRMTSDTLEVHYAPRSGAAKKKAGASGFGGGSTEITHLVARGNVYIRSEKGNAQTATGNWARFDVRKRIITMGDHVNLKQGKNVIRGTSLRIDLNTGRSKVSSSTARNTTTTGGRIRMVIQPDKALRRGLKRPGGTGKRSKSRSTSASQPVRVTRGQQ